MCDFTPGFIMDGHILSGYCQGALSGCVVRVRVALCDATMRAVSHMLNAFKTKNNMVIFTFPLSPKGNNNKDK